MIQRERSYVQSLLAVRIPHVGAGLDVAYTLHGKERLELLDLEVYRSIHHVAEHLDVRVLVHTLLDQVARDDRRSR